MWKPITGFEGLYDVSETGCIRNARTLKVLKPNKIGKGYLIVHLKKDGKRYARYVHRLTAEAYVPNPHNHPVVNHDDGNKENCHYTNLIWSTYSENNQHAYDTGLKPRGEGQYKAFIRRLCGGLRGRLGRRLGGRIRGSLGGDSRGLGRCRGGIRFIFLQNEHDHQIEKQNNG